MPSKYGLGKVPRLLPCHSLGFGERGNEELIVMNEKKYTYARNCEG